VEDEGNCEESWSVGILGTPTKLPCKASDSSFTATGPVKQTWSRHADFQDVGSCFPLAHLPLVDIRTTVKKYDWCVENDDCFFETMELTTDAMRAQVSPQCLTNTRNNV